MGKNTDLEFGMDFIMIVIKVNGEKIKHKDLELINGAMEIDMKGNGLHL